MCTFTVSITSLKPLLSVTNAKSNGQFLFLILAHLSAALGTVDPFLLETFSSSGFWDNTFSWIPSYLIYYFFKRFYLFVFKQRGRKRGKHQCVVASHVPPTGGLAHKPGTCPDWESNWQPFGSQAGTQPTEPHQPGPNFLFIILLEHTEICKILLQVLSYCKDAISILGTSIL